MSDMTSFRVSSSNARAASDRTYSDASGFGKVVLYIFLISLIISFSFKVGGLRLTPYRIVLLVMFVPLLVSWVAGLCGRFRIADFALVGFTIWMYMSYLVNQGLDQVELATITMIETLGPYLLARRYVRSRENFLVVGKILFGILLLFTLVVFLENTRGSRLFEKVYSVFGSAFSLGTERRMGLIRSSGPFEHPILYGVFCAIPFAILYHMPRQGQDGPAGLRKAWVSLVTTFYSLSMGAFLNVFVQVGLIAWNWIFRRFSARWWWLTGLTIFGYVFVDVFSNRTPFEVFITYASFNYGNAYMRVVIFIEGMVSVRANPLFGFGYCCWIRPDWMWSIPSVDNFWLLITMRHGIPAFLMVLLAYVSVIIGLIRAQATAEIDANIRNALVFALIGLAVSIATVHLWGATYSFMMFILGSAAWMSDARSSDTAATNRTEDGPADQAAADPVSPPNRYTRFPHKK